MALTAKFVSDFTRFYADVQKATVMLGGFQDDADKTAASLNRVATSLSGKTLITNATNMVAAVEAIGGASKLTDAELKKVGATVADAVVKMEKMGIAVPQSFKDIQAATAGATQAAFDWKSALVSAAGALGIAFSANALKNFVIGVIDTGAKIGDLSEKLGISAEAVQRFDYAAEQSGASIETVDRAIKAMNVNLSEGSKSTIAALTEAGLRFEDIRKMSPEKAFVAIGDAVARIEDPMLRAKVATELFGKAGQELIPTFLSGITKIGKETSVMADDTVRRLKEAQDAWGRFKNAVVVASGEWIAAVEKDAQRWIKAVAALGKPPQDLWKFLQSFRDQSGAIAQSASDLGAMAASVTPPVQNFADRALKPVALNADQAEAAIGWLNATLTKVPEPTKQAVAATEALNQSLERVRYTQFQMGQSAVAATQNVQGFGIRMSEVVQINRDFSEILTASTIHADKFGHVLTTNVLPSLQGIGGATYQAGLRIKDTTTWQQTLNSRMDDVTGILGGIQTGWAQMATVGAKAIQGITNDLLAGNWIGAITKATAALGGFIAKLLSGSEESKKVSPIRDEFFKLQGGLETLNPKVQALTGNLTAVQAVFDAKTVQQYDAAIANLNRILAMEQTALDNATDSAEEYSAALRKIPSKIPIDIRYTESGAIPSGGKAVPGYATGTNGFVDFGAGTLAMLHGKEMVVPESAVQSAGGGGLPSGAPITIVINAQGSFYDTPGDLQRLADKINAALTAKHGLTNRVRAA
jgi:hypothetical protein